MVDFRSGYSEQSSKVFSPHSQAADATTWSGQEAKEAASKTVGPLWSRLLAAAIFSVAAHAWAGGGPEGMLLVVNPRSADSMTIANHYAQLRQVPADNIVYLPWEPKEQSTDVNTFRQKILLPLLHTINARRLGNQIDSIVYSSDYPTAISFEADLDKIKQMPRLPELPPPYIQSVTEWPQGSINGLTYLWQGTIVGVPTDLLLYNNFYVRMPPKPGGQLDSVAFRGNREYKPGGDVVAEGGRRYLLSVMLGVTAGRGNTLSEVLAYLQRSASADGTQPKGTIYFVQNNDIRSRVRHDLFKMALEELKPLGVAAKIVQGTVPLDRPDVQGVVMGTSDFEWKASGSTILPGAICEHFTSYGGVMKTPAGQTPLSEFLRYGAAGASGTVTEPMSIRNKFPLPMIQVHYARGCTLAEAFYQSIMAPYQLLIVGDPLCRPWAKIPQVSLSGVEPGAVVRGTLVVKPDATTPEGTPVALFRLVLDGVTMAECKPGDSMELDTTKQADGYHDLRIVAIGPEPIESQGRKVVPLRFENHGRTIEASLATQGRLASDKPLAISAKSPGSEAIVVVQGSRVVGHLKGAEGRIEIPPNTLGAGPVRLRVAGLGASGATSNVIAPPIDVVIE